MRVAIVVICHVDHAEHERLAETSKLTMGKTATDEVKIWYVWGAGRNKKDDNDYITDFHEDRGAILKKTLSFIEWYRNEPFDYIFRVNDGAYIDIPNMLEFLKDKPRERFYCGTPGSVDGIRFCSGSGFFLSRDLVQMIYENKWEFHDRHIDDVAIGEFMMNHGVPVDERATRVILYYDEWTRTIGENVVTKEEFGDTKVYHWRLRCDDGMREVDCEHMKRLYNTLHK